MAKPRCPECGNAKWHGYLTVNSSASINSSGMPVNVGMFGTQLDLCGNFRLFEEPNYFTDLFLVSLTQTFILTTLTEMVLITPMRTYESRPVPRTHTIAVRPQRT